jgi:hypothetical protein
MVWMSSLTPSRAVTSKGWRTVVSGGVTYAATGVSSKPTTLMSSGTRRPASSSARISPMAMSSFAANTAVTEASPASAWPAA